MTENAYGEKEMGGIKLAFSLILNSFGKDSTKVGMNVISFVDCLFMGTALLSECVIYFCWES